MASSNSPDLDASLALIMESSCLVSLSCSPLTCRRSPSHSQLAWSRLRSRCVRVREMSSKETFAWACCASEDSEGTISIRQSRRTISSSSGTREMNFFATKFSRSTAVASMESSAAGEEREGGRELRELGLRSLARSREKELNLIESEWSSLFFTGDISFPSSSYFLLPCGPERLPGSLLGRREMVERMVWTADRMLLRASFSFSCDCDAFLLETELLVHETTLKTSRTITPMSLPIF
mmetsp:Transcript_9976/g.22761  ORF Transcript_9976/g.22761 Transcript_9976/m.22761 type:complete len:238 (-) Transcript_9976:326-1039(-)